MQTQLTLDGIYLLRFEIGEEISSGLVGFAEKQNIAAAQVQAIGAIKDFEIGYFRLAEKQYIRAKFEENAELITCVGNISLKDGKPFPHLHAALARQDYQVIGGHFFSGICAVTVEAIVRPLNTAVSRKFDELTGLFLWDLCEAL